MGSAAVIGLLPGQAQRVLKDFPLRGLKFIPKDREHEVPEITQGFDHVLVMTKFISHALWHRIPDTQLIPVNGGLTELRRKIAALVPEPTPEEHPVARARAEHDFSALRGAEPGTRLFFKRPPGVTKGSYWKRVQVTRSYYKRQWGIETQQFEADGGIDILINGTAPTPEATPEAQPEAVPEALRQFWSDAYLRLITACPGAPDELLAARADAAVAALRHRFP